MPEELHTPKKSLKQLEKENKKPLSVVEGHTIGQVVVGAFSGVLIGVIIGCLTKA